MENEITYLGKVIRVDTNMIEVEISNKVPTFSPIIEGKVYKIGQVGTFIKIPIGNVTTYGIVSCVSNSPSKEDEYNNVHNEGSRFLTVNLIGEKVGNKRFEKGIGLYPTINDEVHIVTDEDLKDIYETRKPGTIQIGRHSSSDNLEVVVDLHNLVLRHSAILGSTGSGKSNTTVALIKRIINDLTNSRIVLIDPHGEYPSA